MGVKALDYESINENMKKVQYAVRGELYLRASELQKEGKKVCISKLFFFKCLLIHMALDGIYLCFHFYNFQIIFTNVGNPHALGQKPLTFPRQVHFNFLLL